MTIPLQRQTTNFHFLVMYKAYNQEGLLRLKSQMDKVAHQVFVFSLQTSNSDPLVTAALNWWVWLSNIVASTHQLIGSYVTQFYKLFD